MSEQENTFCLFILIFISAAMISLMMAYHLMITHLENFLAYKRENEDQTSKGLNKNCRKFQVKDTFGTEMNCPSFLDFLYLELMSYTSSCNLNII